MLLKVGGPESGVMEMDRQQEGGDGMVIPTV